MNTKIFISSKKELKFLKVLNRRKRKHNYLYRLLSYSIYSTRILSEFYIIIENAQSEGDREELRHLETELNGECLFRRSKTENFADTV